MMMMMMMPPHLALANAQPFPPTHRHTTSHGSFLTTTTLGKTRRYVRRGVWQALASKSFLLPCIPPPIGIAKSSRASAAGPWPPFPPHILGLRDAHGLPRHGFVVLAG